MTVMVTTRIPHLPADAYDRTAAQLDEPLRQTPGFISHAAAVDDEGVTVTELWQAEEDWRRFFEQNVAPNLPATLAPPAVVELRNAILR